MIPKNQTEAEILQRLQKLETKSFGATAEMNYHQNTGRRDTGRTDEFSNESPQKDYDDYRNRYPKEDETAREDAKAISNDEIPNQHIGNHSTEALEQQIFSLLNTKPAFRTKKWFGKFRVVSTNLAKMRKEITETKFNQLMEEMNDIIGGKFQ